MNASANYLAVMPDCRGAADNEARKARSAIGFDGVGRLAKLVAPFLAEQGVENDRLRLKTLTARRDHAIANLMAAQATMALADRALASHQRAMEGGA